MCELLDAAKTEAKRRRLDPNLVRCLVLGIGGICDGTSCVSLDLSEPLDPDTLAALGQQNMEKFYNRIEAHQTLVH